MAEFCRTSASENQDGPAAVVTLLLESDRPNEGQVAGAMFWLMRKKLSGSNLRLISDRR
jgi:hypothetical protein